MSNNNNDQVWKSLLSGGISNSVASFFLNWSDCVKLRIQTDIDRIHYKTVRQAVWKIYTEEGLSSLLFPGVIPSMMREMSYSSLRFGMYPYVKEFVAKLHPESMANPPGLGDVGLANKVASGAICGMIGSGLASPTDRVKILFQTEAGLLGKDNIYLTGLRKGYPSSYGGRGQDFGSTFRAFVSIARDEGFFSGLYRGYFSTVIRASLLASAQLASYDHTKYLLSRKWNLLEEGVFLHISCSLWAAVCATIASQPADVIKSRLMGDKHVLYKGNLDCILKTYQHDGILGFYRGGIPSFLRLGPHFCIALPLFEQTRKLLGLSYL